MDHDHLHRSPTGNGYHHEVQDPWAGSNSSPYASQHQSPVYEHTGFTFSSNPMETMYMTTTSMLPPQTRMTSLQQLQPLMVPPWPSQLTNTSPYHTPVYTHTPSSATSIPTPVSAPPTTGRQSDRPRKTLTDSDRRRMCKYAEDNPNVKQTEIGGKKAQNSADID
jgi:hypothetical protein